MTERELIEELVKLQISQTTLLTRLLESNLQRTAEATETKDEAAEDPNRPSEIGDRVTILTT